MATPTPTPPSSDLMSAHLRAAGLRQTACRLELLLEIHSKSGPTALSHLENSLPNFDRATVYRTLQSFLTAGLVHRTSDSGGHPHYAPGSPDPMRAPHAHFECQHCGQLFCFEWVNRPEPTLPAGFVAEEQELRLRGLCDVCVKLTSE